MYLSRLTLKRFRSCEDLAVPLQSELTVLAGENNGGKSNIVDAIRLLTLPLNGRRELYCESTDLRNCPDADPTDGTAPARREFVLEACYQGLTLAQRGLWIAATPDPMKDCAIFGLTHEVIEPRGKTTMWAGKYQTAEPERGSTDLVRHVYLPALRDAQRALASGNANRIVALLMHFLDGLDPKDFVAQLQRNVQSNQIIENINKEIGSRLQELTGGVRPQTAELGFAEETVADIARDLRFKMADAGTDMANIASSGLGYANLLYMAATIVELAKAREADLTLFLVEEPEAHLHPQLQMLVLDFLLQEAKKSKKRKVNPGHPEGHIQVVVTTHSPNLTARISPEHLVILRSIATRNQDGSTISHKTASVPIAELGLEKSTIRKIRRYLDVTRSALLFGTRALLVEGIGEALLMPMFAQKLRDENQLTEQQWKRFQGVTIVTVDGVDFGPYLEVLLRSQSDVRIADLVVVITDEDPTINFDRADQLCDLARDLHAESALKVFTCPNTLEVALYDSNSDVMKKAFKAIHPRLYEQLEQRLANVPVNHHASSFSQFIKEKDVRKGDLVQVFCEFAEERTDVVVPDHIKKAILEITAP